MLARRTWVALECLMFPVANSGLGLFSRHGCVGCAVSGCGKRLYSGAFHTAITKTLLLMHKKIKNELPCLISDLFKTVCPGRSARNTKHFEEPFTYKIYKAHTVSWVGPRLWNKVMTPLFPLVQTVPITKYAIKMVTKQHFLNLY